MTINMYIATFAWILLVAGYFQRNNREIHAALMVTGILLDYGLVLYLQLSRDAVQTAAGFTLEPLQQCHILVSTLAIILYIPVLILGIKLWRGDTEPVTKIRHVRLALSAFICRTLGFLLMFSMVK